MSESKPLRIAIVACRKAREQNLCPGDAKCLVAFMRKEGKFAELKDKNAVIVGIIDCGDCPGTRAGVALGLLKMHLDSLGEKIDAIYIGTCVVRLCPHKDEIVARIKKIAEVPVIEGTHEYQLRIP